MVSFIALIMHWKDQFLLTSQAAFADQKSVTFNEYSTNFPILYTFSCTSNIQEVEDDQNSMLVKQYLSIGTKIHFPMSATFYLFHIPKEICVFHEGVTSLEKFNNLWDIIV